MEKVFKQSGKYLLNYKKSNPYYKYYFIGLSTSGGVEIELCADDISDIFSYLYSKRYLAVSTINKEYNIRAMKDEEKAFCIMYRFNHYKMQKIAHDLGDYENLKNKNKYLNRDKKTLLMQDFLSTPDAVAKAVRATGLTRMCIFNYKTGRNVPSVLDYYKICLACDINPFKSLIAECEYLLKKEGAENKDI